MIANYGPRTTALIVLDDGVYEFSHDANGPGTGWLCSCQRIVIAQESTMFSPGYRRPGRACPLPLCCAFPNRLLAHPVI